MTVRVQLLLPTGIPTLLPNQEPVLPQMHQISLPLQKMDHPTLQVQVPQLHHLPQQQVQILTRPHQRTFDTNTPSRPYTSSRPTENPPWNPTSSTADSPSTQCAPHRECPPPSNPRLPTQPSKLP